MAASGTPEFAPGGLGRACTRGNRVTVTSYPCGTAQSRATTNGCDGGGYGRLPVALARICGKFIARLGSSTRALFPPPANRLAQHRVGSIFGRDGRFYRPVRFTRVARDSHIGVDIRWRVPVHSSIGGNWITSVVAVFQNFIALGLAGVTNSSWKNRSLSLRVSRIYDRRFLRDRVDWTKRIEREPAAAYLPSAPLSGRRVSLQPVHFAAVRGKAPAAVRLCLRNLNLARCSAKIAQAVLMRPASG